MRRLGGPAALVGLVLVAGCTQPTPAVTVQSGSASVRSEAVQYLRDGKAVGTRKGPKVLKVRVGQTVNISVDGTTADAGWAVLLAGQQIAPVFTGGRHTYSFQVPSFSNSTEATLAVFQQAKGSTSAAGAWLFTLRESA